MTSARPVWLTREQHDKAARAGRYLYETGRFDDSQAILDILTAWDAAPADATEAAVRMLRTTEFDETDTWKDETIVAVVLRALGMPEAT